MTEDGGRESQATFIGEFSPILADVFLRAHLGPTGRAAYLSVESLSVLCSSLAVSAAAQAWGVRAVYGWTTAARVALGLVALLAPPHGVVGAAYLFFCNLCTSAGTFHPFGSRCWSLDTGASAKLTRLIVHETLLRHRVRRLACACRLSRRRVAMARFGPRQAPRRLSRLSHLRRKRRPLLIRPLLIHPAKTAGGEVDVGRAGTLHTAT